MSSQPTDRASIGPGSRSLFEGLTVLELGHVIAGPFAGSLMGDHGAMIVKVEDPKAGDMMRRNGPAKDGEKLWWKVAARNKKSVTIDLRQAEGQALLRRMAAKADVVIENFRPGTLERWNIGWNDLQAVNPRLIMLRISGYGQSGPESTKGGFGRCGEAMSGAVAITGHADRPPSHFGFSLGDLATGLMGAFAISGALYRREVARDDFPGECIDLALYETLFRFIDWQVILYDQLGFVPKRNGNKFPVGPSPVSDTYFSRDGNWITIASGTVNSVLNILSVTDKSLIGDPRFATQEAQMQNGPFLGAMVRDWISKTDAADVLSECARAGVAAAPVMTPVEMFASETFRQRESIVSVEDPRLGAVAMCGVVPRMVNHQGRIQSTGPELGQHTREVIQGWLGLKDEEVESLERGGTIRATPSAS